MVVSWTFCVIFFFDNLPIIFDGRNKKWGKKFCQEVPLLFVEQARFLYEERPKLTFSNHEISKGHTVWTVVNKLAWFSRFVFGLKNLHVSRAGQANRWIPTQPVFKTLHVQTRLDIAYVKPDAYILKLCSST